MEAGGWPMGSMMKAVPRGGVGRCRGAKRVRVEGRGRGGSNMRALPEGGDGSVA